METQEIQADVKKPSSAQLIWIVLLGLIVSGSLIQIKVAHTGIVETFLLYFLVLQVGIGGLFCFVGSYFVADKVAKAIGWPAGNPFQTELAFANLSLGVLGILCIWLRGNFWIATGIAYSVFFFGGAWVHINEEVLKKKNFSIAITAPVLYTDIIGPIAMIGLLIAYFWGDG